MIEKIRRSINSGNYESDLYIEFTKFQQDEDSLILTCSIYIEEAEEGKLVEQWLIQCLNWQDYRLESFISWEEEEFEVTNDHPFLWDYHESLIELYFRGEPKEILALIGALYLKHCSLTENLIPLSQYVNINAGAGDLEKLLNGNHGLFSMAPQILTEAYRELLEAYGFSTSLLMQKEMQHPEEFKLLRLGPSYIIAKEFKAIQLDIENFSV